MLKSKQISDKLILLVKEIPYGQVKKIQLTLSARHPFQNFSTPCILNVNNTGANQRSIMK
jgi:hypothetical protein